MNKIIVETERASLVHMDLSHVDLMIQLFNIDKKEALDWINENKSLQQRKGFSALNVFDKKTGKYIGHCGCREIKLKDNMEVELSWGIDKEFKEDDIDVEVVFAVRNYMFKHFNINSLVAVISMKEPHNMNIAETIDMENEYSFFEGFHKFYVYVVNRRSEKFKASFGAGGSGETFTSSLARDKFSPSLVRNLRRPRPRPR